MRKGFKKSELTLQSWLSKLKRRPFSRVDRSELKICDISLSSIFAASLLQCARSVFFFLTHRCPDLYHQTSHSALYFLMQIPWYQEYRNRALFTQHTQVMCTFTLHIVKKKVLREIFIII